MTTTHAKAVILIHSRQLQRPTHNSRSGHPEDPGRSSSSLFGMAALYRWHARLATVQNTSDSQQH